MIYKSLLPILMALIIMSALTTYLIRYVGGETSRALTLENEYLLTINVFRQLNNSLPQVLQTDACLVITNPIKYSCNYVATNITQALNEVLSTISNGTGDAVRYWVVNYVINGVGNETTYRAVVRAVVGSSDVYGVVAATYPINLCRYSQVVHDIVDGMSANATIHASNVISAVQGIANYLAGRIGHGHYGMNITLYYVGVFTMIERTRNYTVYWGPIDYVLYISPIENPCGSAAEISGRFYISVVINAYVNNTYYFAANGVINNDNS